TTSHRDLHSFPTRRSSDLKPAPLVPRQWRLPVRERVAADGAVLLALDERSVMDAVKVLKSERIESVAVGFLHSYANPAHEQRVRSEEHTSELQSLAYLVCR